MLNGAERSQHIYLRFSQKHTGYFQVQLHKRVFDSKGSLWDRNAPFRKRVEVLDNVVLPGLRRGKSPPPGRM